MIQNEIYSNNTIILDKYDCLNLGSATINNLMKSSIIKEYSVNTKTLNPIIYENNNLINLEIKPKENGKFINISTDFKSKLFEKFMKHSDEKSNTGQFFTPLKIVNEMIEMVDIYEGMSICDPACGVGKFLLEAIEDKIPEYFNYKTEKLEKNIDIIGFDNNISKN